VLLNANNRSTPKAYIINGRAAKPVPVTTSLETAKGRTSFILTIENTIISRIKTTVEYAELI
jgi:hypothetical protein